MEHWNGALLGDPTIKVFCAGCNIEIGTLKQWTDKYCPLCLKGGVKNRTK